MFYYWVYKPGHVYDEGIMCGKKSLPIYIINPRFEWYAVWGCCQTQVEIYFSLVYYEA